MSDSWKERFIEAAKSLETPAWAAERIGEEVAEVSNRDSLQAWKNEVEEFYTDHPGQSMELRGALASLWVRATAEEGNAEGVLPLPKDLRKDTIPILADYTERIKNAPAKEISREREV